MRQTNRAVAARPHEPTPSNTALPTTGANNELWLTTEEACAHLRLPSRGALYQRVRRGQVHAHRFLNGRSMRFLRSELDALLASDGVR